MFSRRKPPQLTSLEELQRAYDDCCNLSLQNLTLEEDNKLDLALNGWKSLHTSMLYRTDLFDKQASKYDSEELRILQELKDIRDQNVRHLIRVQMRIDENDRKTALQARPGINPQASNSSSSGGSSMSVPSLRNSNAPSSRSLSSSTQNRQMLKSLRPSGGANSSTRVNTANAAKAASVSWRQPTQHSYQQHQQSNASPYASASAGQSQSNRISTGSSSAFPDFDQDWERVRTRSPTPDLIDLDEDLRGLGLSNGGYTQSMDDLHRDEQKSKLAPPPPPPSRSTRGSSTSPKPSLTQASKSTPDIRTTSNTSTSTNSNGDPPAPKKYIYNKPKPLNVNGIMRAQAKKKASSASSASASSSSSSTAATSRKAATTATSARPTKPVASSAAAAKTNPTTYTSTTIPKIYVKKAAAGANGTPKAASASGTPKAKSLTKKTVQATTPPPEINSPTMDDILGGYDSQIPVTEKETAAAAAAEAEAEGMNDDQENELLSSIRGIDFDSGKQILNDIVIHGDEVHWNDIAGLESAKNSLKEAVVYPFLRPDLFSGLREPARGLLLFGPPGTGKTMLARAVATESKSTFFSISASSLTSKYLGESEKLVKALFLLARKLSPSIVFVDEIDSLLSTRTDGEVDSSRRIKNEFLIQWSELSSAAAGKDSSTSSADGDVTRVLILGATNVPWAIDEAARRRFVRRQYIPLPENETRKVHLHHLLGHQKHTLTEADFDELVKLTQGFSGSDITALAKDAAMGPLRSLGDLILATPRDQIRPVSLEDFVASLSYIRPSVSPEGLTQHEEWAAMYGSYGG